MAVLAYLGAVANEFTCNPWEKKWMHRHLFLGLVQYGTTGKCHSFCCKYFFMTFLNCRFLLLSIFNSTVQSLHCHSNNMWQARRWRCLNHCHNQNVLGLLSARVTSKCTEQYGYKETPYRPRHHQDITKLISESDSDAHSSEDRRYFCSEWWRHRWRYWNKLHTVDLQYILSNYCTCSPYIYRESQ